MKIFLFLLLGATGLYMALQGTQVAQAPSLSYKDTQGAVHRIPEPGKTAVLVFWVSPCPYCDRALTVLDHLTTRLPSDKVDVVGIYLNHGTAAEVDAEAQREGHGTLMAPAQPTSDQTLIAALDSGFKFGSPGRAIYVVDSAGSIHSVDSSNLDFPTSGIESQVVDLVANVSGAGSRQAPSSTAEDRTPVGDGGAQSYSKE